MEFQNQAVSGGIAVERKSFTWTIENFDIVRQSDDYIISQKFKFVAGETLGVSTKWMVKLQVEAENVKSSDDEKWIGFYLNLLGIETADDTEQHQTPRKDVNAAFTLDISGSNPRRASFFRETCSLENYLKDGKPLGWGFGRVLRKDAKVYDLPLINGCLIMKLEIQVCGKPHTVPTFLKTFPNDVGILENQYKTKFLEKLVQDMKQAVNRPLPRSDAQTKIVSKDGEEFEVNRGILYARSPVFEKMFQTAMTESENGVIRIKDISSKSIRIILRFIYCGELGNDWHESDVIGELVYAAAKYQLSDLLEFLNKIVGSVCSKENVGDLINLTRKLSLHEAEKSLLEFMKKNTATYDDIILFAKSTSKWHDFESGANNSETKGNSSDTGNDGCKTENDGSKTETDGCKTETDGSKTDNDGSKTENGDSITDHVDLIFKNFEDILNKKFKSALQDQPHN